MPVITVGLCQVPGRGCVPSERVLSVGDWPHVIGTYAGSVVTPEVIEDETLGNRPVDALPVDDHRLSGLVAVTGLVVVRTHAHVPVAVIVQRLVPDPAVVFTSDDVVKLASVVSMDEPAMFPFDPAISSVVPGPDAGVSATAALTQMIGLHKMTIIAEVSHAA